MGGKFMRLTLLAALALVFAGCNNDTETVSYYQPAFHYTSKVEPSQESPFVGKVRFETMPIRLLVLKHCPDDIADIDANQAVQAANVAKSKGLTIETIGPYHVDKQGQTDSIAWGKKVSLNDLDGLQRFISAQMKVDAVAGDTIIVYTIGHGGGSGSIMRLGQREGVMKAIAKAAEENDQETLWWQLSCHAAAKLPPISILNERQQELFSMTASSPANKLSYFNTQGKQFAAIFNAMAAKSSSIDPNGDEMITADELSKFLIKGFGQERGELVFAKSPDEPIFGYNGLANQIPIRDRNGQQGDYPRNYIPLPRR
jgi:hypothetical protein